MQLLVTGGSGFIGSNFIRMMLAVHADIRITNLDALTYAGNPDNLRDVATDGRYSFVRGDICDAPLVASLLRRDGIDTVVHFAAESHVDRSLTDPGSFIRTNVVGTHTLLEAALNHEVQRFFHVSTDEVYGSIADGSFAEKDPLNPSSPYSSSKAASDLIARSYFITYGLPVVISRCTNNYGPYQYPEKLIPLFTTNLLENQKVPVYGTGKNIRDWIYVLDHCRAIDFLLSRATNGEIYNIGSGIERTNLEITRTILDLLGKDDSSIQYVTDRPGHDLRYSLDASRLHGMGWKPAYNFGQGIAETVAWYRKNRWWWFPLKHPGVVQ